MATTRDADALAPRSPQPLRPVATGSRLTPTRTASGSSPLPPRSGAAASPRNATGSPPAASSPALRGAFGNARALPASASTGSLVTSANTGRPAEKAGSEEAVAGCSGGGSNPFNPASFFKSIDDFSLPMRDFFTKNVLAVSLVPIPTFLDEREVLRARLRDLEERLHTLEAASAAEIRELKAALARAEGQLEGSKLERAKSAVETMKHWRQHRREVEKLRDDQAALMASVGDLRAVRAEADAARAERDAALARAAAAEAQLAQRKR